MSDVDNDESPLVSVGDRLSIHWPYTDSTHTKVKVDVISVRSSKKRKNCSSFKYELRFKDGEVHSTRLNHLKWRKIRRKDAEIPSSSTSQHSVANPEKAMLICKYKKHLPTHKRIVAPMVGGSELAFRLLCRR